MGLHKRKGTIAANHYPELLDRGRLPVELIDDLYNELDVYIDTDYRVDARMPGREWLLSLGDAETCEYLLSLDREWLEVHLSGAERPLSASLHSLIEAIRQPAPGTADDGDADPYPLPRGRMLTGC